MNSYTDRVKKVLALSREEAIRLGSDYLGTEHLLLGLIKEGDGVAVEFLRSTHIDLEGITKSLEKDILNKSHGPCPSVGQMVPFTPRAKKVLERADQAMSNKYVGTEHLLLSILNEPASEASKILALAGIGYEETKKEINRILRGDKALKPEANQEYKIAKALFKLQKLLVEDMNTANKYLLQKDTENFERYKLAYQTVQECIEILTTEVKE